MDELASYRDDPTLLVYEARDARDVRRIRREVEGRRWAADHGIPTAETVAKARDDRWLVTRWIPEEPSESLDYVAAAHEMAQRIERLPRPRFVTPGSSWRAPRWSRPVRVGRLLAAGLDPRTFVRTRRAYDELPREVTLHNDYHRQNVLNTTAARGHVTVVDWEFTAVGPRHQDMVRLVVDLRDPGLAREAWELLLRSVPGADHAALAAQLRWLALRTYATELTVPRRDRDPAQSARRRARWRDAQEWAGELTPAPGR